MPVGSGIPVCMAASKVGASGRRIGFSLKEVALGWMIGTLRRAAFECTEVAGVNEGRCRFAFLPGDVFDCPTGLSDAPGARICISGRTPDCAQMVRRFARQR